MAQGMRGYTVARKRLGSWFERSGYTKVHVGRQLGRDGAWFAAILSGKSRLGAEMIGPLSEVTGIPEMLLLYPEKPKQDQANAEWIAARQKKAGNAATVSRSSRTSADGKKTQVQCTSCNGRGWNWKDVVVQEE